MPRYRFTGTNSEGQHVTGERDAPDPDALLNAIRDEVLLVDSVLLVGTVGSLDRPEVVAHDPELEFAQAPGSEKPVAPAPGSAAHNVEHMHPEDAGEISRHMAEIIGSGLPLETGLAAIAAECPSRRMRRTLGGIVADLVAGNDLEFAMATRHAPAELRALVRAGARSGDTGRILEHYVTNVQGAAELRDSIFLGLLYPSVILVMFLSLGWGMMWWIVPQFTAIFNGFDLDLPWLTKGLIAISDFLNHYALWTGGEVFVAIVLVALLLRYALGPVGMRRLVCCIPLIGPILRWIALARFSQLLSLLVENRVPLSEALVLAGDASRDAEIKDDCRRLLVGVKSGETLESAARKLKRFPASFVQALGWEGRSGGLPEVLQSLGDMYAGRVRAAVAVMMSVLPPLLMLFLGGAVGLLVIALFMPLLELLNKLS